MQRTASVLILLLGGVVIATVWVLRNPPGDLMPSVERIEGPIMTLSPRRYEHPLHLQSPTDPNLPVYNYNWRRHARAEWRQQNFKIAEEFYKTALVYEPKHSGNLEAHQRIGESAYRDQRYEEACNRFYTIQLERPHELNSYTQLAIALFCSNHLYEAERIARKGLETPVGIEQPGGLYFILYRIYDNLGMEGFKSEFQTKAYSEFVALGEGIIQYITDELYDCLIE